MIIIKNIDNKKECIIAALDENDLRNDFQGLFASILEKTEVTMIFLEELSNIQPKLEERIKDVQNSISDSDRE